MALPLAYHRFSGAEPETGRSPELEAPDQWLFALRRVVSASAMPTATAPAPARLPMAITVRLDSPEAAREAVSRPGRLGVEARQGDDRTLEGRVERRADGVTW